MRIPVKNMSCMISCERRSRSSDKESPGRLFPVSTRGGKHVVRPFARVELLFNFPNNSTSICDTGLLPQIQVQSAYTSHNLALVMHLTNLSRVWLQLRVTSATKRGLPC